MLNNNAELDNGVYNENEEEEKKQEEAKKAEEDKALLGLNEPIMNKAPPADSQFIIAPSSLSKPQSNFNHSAPQSNLQSLNTSQIMIDEEKIHKMKDLYGYEPEYVYDQLENDELNHATSTYFLMNQEKEF